MKRQYKLIVDTIRELEKQGRIILGNPYSTKELKQLICVTAGIDEGSFHPSDYSYNMVNKGNIDRQDKYRPLFTQIKHGFHRYDGLNY